MQNHTILVLNPNLKGIVIDKGRCTILHRERDIHCTLPFEQFSKIFSTKRGERINPLETSVFNYDTQGNVFIESRKGHIDALIHLNPKFTYVAMDSDGEWKAFIRKPKYRKLTQSWVCYKKGLETRTTLNLNKVLVIPVDPEGSSKSLHKRQNGEWVRVC